MTIQKPWWIAGDVNQVIAYEFAKKNSMWEFSGNQTKITIYNNAIPEHQIQALCFIEEALNPEQVTILYKMAEENKIIQGAYDSWNHFLLVHKLQSSV